MEFTCSTEAIPNPWSPDRSRFVDDVRNRTRILYTYDFLFFWVAGELSCGSHINCSFYIIYIVEGILRLNRFIAVALIVVNK